MRILNSFVTLVFSVGLVLQPVYAVVGALKRAQNLFKATRASAIGFGQILGLHDGNAAMDGKVIAASVNRVSAALNKTAQDLVGFNATAAGPNSPQFPLVAETLTSFTEATVEMFNAARNQVSKRHDVTALNGYRKPVLPSLDAFYNTFQTFLFLFAPTFPSIGDIVDHQVGRAFQALDTAIYVWY